MEFLLETYTFLYSNFKTCEEEKIIWELKKGNFSLTKISIRIQSIRNHSEHIAYSGKIQIFKWLKDKFHINWNDLMCGCAANNGKLQMLKWLRTPNAKYGTPYSLNEWTCAYAAENGQLKVLKWLRTPSEKYGTPCPWNEITCEFAVVGKNLEVLKWLRTPDPKYGTPCPWNSDCYYHSRTREISDWLITNGCPQY